jgi:hypothetical protein
VGDALKNELEWRILVAIDFWQRKENHAGGG